ncbi:hypothetical protein TRFO_04916 [Tritrichomonas foetus]|uniref:CS domain-containing protein n=1 Tax=Tritrichomonas foetus TaxID=1144522 RepID=A0A1J4KA46_9EUKA|nr:hypothetical protein TRFO_04916 [Tritrichomonas foetus]|eukprot:OHT08303.1 hypothetical protein TRFO_04916 [Tritrichomonas foetus]
MNQIPPALHPAYDWKFEQNEKEVIVTFQFPPTFNIHSFQANLTNDNQCIRCDAPNHIPFLCGHLNSPADSINVEFLEDSNTVNLHIIKSKEEVWKIVIQSFTPQTGEIDPKSAFLIFSVLSNQDVSDEIKDSIAALLKSSAQAGYVPALLTFGNICIKLETVQHVGFSMLQTAAEMYQSPEAFCHLGSFMLRQNEIEQGLIMLNESLRMGYTNAALIIGRTLSPFSPLPSLEKKNGQKALEMFEKCPLPDSKYEMAKILIKGCEGVPEDSERAKKLYSEAKAELPQLPPLEEVIAKAENKEQGVNGIMVVAAGVVAVFGFILYNHVKRYRK